MTFERILLVSTEQCDARPALARSLSIASRHGASITLLHVPEPLSDVARALPTNVLSSLEAALEQSRKDLFAALTTGAAAAGVQCATAIGSGPPFRAAIKAVLRDGHDLVLKTTDSRRPGARSAHGGNDNHLLRKCPCPVWLVDPDGLAKHRRVLAAVNPDPSEPEDAALSQRILQAAVEAAALDGAELEVVHAWKVLGEWPRGAQPLRSDPEVDHIMGKALNRYTMLLDELVEREAPHGAVTRKHVVHGRAADVIVDVARTREPNLLVMGTVGRSGISGLLIGNTAEQVLAEITCSVLALKPAGFRSPVTLD